MFPKRLLTAIGLGICLALIGCSGNPEADTSFDTPLAQIEPSATSPVDLVTASPAAPTAASTNTTAPSAAPRPTITPTVPPTYMPDMPLTAEGPWLLFTAYIDPADKQYLYAANDDGTGVTQLVSERVSYYAAQPGSSLEEGVAVAYITQTNYETTSDLTLKLLKLPGGEVQTITPLLFDDGSEAAAIAGNELRALIWTNELTWSPDGRALAFIGAMEGDSVDVYTYNRFTDQITRLTDGPLQAYNLSWSPDGQFVIHDATETAMVMGFPQADVMFAARADGLGAIPLISMPENANGDLQIHGWLDSKKLLVSSQYYNYDTETHEATAQVVNLETGETVRVLSGSYRAMAYSVTGDVWLLQPADDESRLVLYSKGKEQEIALEGILYEFWWSETYDTFFAETFGGQLFTISPLGEVTELPIPPDEDGSRPSAHGVVVSPDGAWWAWQQYHFEDAPYLWIGGAMAEPSWIQPGKEDSVVSSVIWSLDGRRLFFADRQEGLWYVEPPDFELVHVSSDVLLVSDFAWIP